jgi:hypothetical protein
MGVECFHLFGKRLLMIKFEALISEFRLLSKWPIFMDIISVAVQTQSLVMRPDHEIMSVSEDI